MKMLTKNKSTKISTPTSENISTGSQIFIFQFSIFPYLCGMKKAIQDFNLGYYILLPVSILATRCHYRQVVIRGRKNLPRGGHYIIAPCHQNALMEPMAVLYFMHRSTVFLARADIFAKPAIRAFLTFLKILPVYRIRDGKSALSKNEEIFETSKKVLLDHTPLCLMAEGRHNDRHQLLPLVKGMFRIAGETQRELGDTPLYIVPAGIDFDDYEQPYSNLVVDIGTPIPVQPFMEEFVTDEPVALNQMREKLAEKLKQQMHHIASQKYYDEVMALCDLLNASWRKRQHRRNTAWGRFATRRDIAVHFNRLVDDRSEETPGAILQARDWLNRCKQLHLDSRSTAFSWPCAVTLALTATIGAFVAATIIWQPLQSALLWILLCNPIILLPTHLLTRRLIKDPQFRSSVNYGIRLVLSLLYVLACSIAVACTHGPAWGCLALLTALATARINALIHPLLRNWLHNLHYCWHRVIHPSEIKQLRHIQRQLEEQI